VAWLPVIGSDVDRRLIDRQSEAERFLLVDRVAEADTAANDSDWKA
jgi:hypothetical protein